jgi:hypothetical protein
MENEIGETTCLKKSPEEPGEQRNNMIIAQQAVTKTLTRVIPLGLQRNYLNPNFTFLFSDHVKLYISQRTGGFIRCYSKRYR